MPKKGKSKANGQFELDTKMEKQSINAEFNILPNDFKPNMFDIEANLKLDSIERDINCEYNSCNIILINLWDIRDGFHQH